MQKYNCPSCGSEITFLSSISVSCVCPYCRSLVVRRDVNVEAMGKMAELPGDISPFQIGTAGIYKKVHFSLIGRMKIGWEEGAWNEWFLWTDEGKKGWLAEAQGALAISFEQEKNDLPPFALTLNQTIIVDKTQFTVSDVKESECIGSEGELPFTAPKGRKTASVDLLSAKGGFAGIEYSEGEAMRFFVGEYVDFDDLKFTNLREITGWDSKQLQRKPVS